MDFGARTEFEERIVKTVDGLPLYVRDYAPALPETGVPVICLHGLTRNSKDFEITAPRIAGLGRRVIVPDMRGRGRSANDPDPAHYTPAVYAQDVLSIMDTLSVPQAVFVGTSMGGIITMVVASVAKQRIAAAVINDIGPTMEKAGLVRIGSYVGRGRLLDSWDQAAETVRSINGGAFPGKLDDSAFWMSFARRTFRERADGKLEADYDPSIALAFADPETSPPIDLTPLFQQLADKPVLSIRGALSDLFSPANVAHMQSVKPDLATYEAPNMGHAPLLAEEGVWDALLEFLAKIP